MTMSSVIKIQILSDSCCTISVGCDTILKAFTSTFVESHQLSVKNFDPEMEVDANLYQYDMVTGK